MWKAIRSFFRDTIEGVIFDAFRTWLMPTALPLGAAYIGHIQGYPWFEIIVGASLVFGGATTGMLMFDQWLERRRANWKIGISNVIVAPDMRGIGMVLGLTFQNKANFPIELKIKELDARLGNTVPKKDYTPKNVIIPATGHGFCCSDTIEMTNHPSPGSLEGILRYEISYGRPGKTVHRLFGKKWIAAKFNEHGAFVTSTWSDLPIEQESYSEPA